MSLSFALAGLTILADWLGSNTCWFDFREPSGRRRALAGDVHCGALVAKIIERRCTMLGLYTPPATTLQVIEAQAPRETSTEQLRRAIERIRGKRLPKPDWSDELPKSESDDPDKLN